MDGNGDLFAPFLKALPPEVDTRVIRYPGDQVLSYGELGPMVAEQLPTDGAFVLLAESYSGPLAVQLAAAGPAGLRGLVLCATFLTRPVSGWKRLAGMLIRAPVMAVLPPAWALRRFLLGPQAPDALVHQLRDAIRSVESRVLTQRMREALVIDVREDFRRVGVPTLCIRAEFDWLIDARTNEVMKALNPLVEICSMAAPHLVLQTRPEEAAAVVLDFIRRTKPNPTVQPYS
jgi:pimeloyl-[acyl-carrier protein] methyl ester esterase